jgi:hypothetical protein
METENILNNSIFHIKYINFWLKPIFNLGIPLVSYSQLLPAIYFWIDISKEEDIFNKYFCLIKSYDRAFSLVFKNDKKI